MSSLSQQQQQQQQRIILFSGAAALLAVGGGLLWLLKRHNTQQYSSARSSGQERLAQALGGGSTNTHENNNNRFRRGGGTAATGRDEEVVPTSNNKTTTTLKTAANTNNTSFPCVSVIFGTNTGTAELFSKTLLSEARLRGWGSTIGDLIAAHEKSSSSSQSASTPPAPFEDPCTELTADTHRAIVSLVDPASEDLVRKTGRCCSAGERDNDGGDENLDDESLLVPFAKYPEGSIVVFIVATYGEGDPTDAIKNTIDQLKKVANTPNVVSKAPLEHLNFCVFGLGDTSYNYFCQTAIDVETAMEKLGATCIHDTEYGDARTNLEEAYDLWREELWGKLSSTLGLPLSEAFDGVPKPELEFRFLPSSKEELEEMLVVQKEAEEQGKGEGEEEGIKTPYTAATPIFDPATPPFPAPPTAMEASLKNPRACKIIENRLLTSPQAVRPVRHIAINIKGMKMTYQAGDHCGILPCNPDSVVREYLTVLGVSEKDWHRGIELLSTARSEARASKKNALPMRVSLFIAMKWYTDLCGVPKRSALRVLGKYLGVSAEASSSSSVPHTVLDLLKQHPTRSTSIPIGHFIEIMPRIAPRYFSIASDQLAQPETIFLTVGILEEGLTSRMLMHEMVSSIDEMTTTSTTENSQKEQQQQQVFIFVRKSTFHLPLLNKKRPLIMIGPGTGVAPLVGFCHRRAGWIKKGTPIGECHLFFGCRKKADDYLYRELLEEWSGSGGGVSEEEKEKSSSSSPRVITQLHVAFSRERESEGGKGEGRKHYVQHDLAAHSETIRSLIVDQQATVFVCGDAARMAKDVEKVLIRQVLMGIKGDEEEAKGLMSRAAAERYVAQMAKSSRYLKDVWTA